MTDTSALEAEALRILKDNPKEVERYKAGKTNVLGFFVGQLMRTTKGQASPGTANDVFKKLLDMQ